MIGFFDILNNKFYYRISYLLLSIMYVSLIGEFKPLNSITSKIMILWSLYIIIMELVFKRLKNYTVFHTLLIGFMIIFLFSTLSNPNKGENIKIMIVTFIQFFALFSLDKDLYLEETLTQIKTLSKIVVFITMIFSAISLGMFILKWEVLIGANKYGFSNNTLTGIYNNENTLGLIAFVSIVFSIIYICQSMETLNYIFVLNILIQIAALIKSKGNSALLALGTFIIISLILYIKNNFIKAVSMLVTFSIGFFSVFKLYSTGRLSHYLNGRYAIWTTAWEIIKENKILGIGNGNIVDRLTQKSGGLLMGVEGGGTHNIFVQISLANGIINTLIFVLFLLTLFIYINKYIVVYRKDKNINLIIILASFLLSLVVINLFEANLMYIVSFIAISFWITLSYIIQILRVNN